MAKKKKAKTPPKVYLVSTQSYSPVLDVVDGIIVTKDRHYVKLLEFEPINFELRSKREQEGICARFASIIKTWPKTVHIKVISVKSDISENIETLEACRDREADEGNGNCATLIDDQIDMLENISKTNGVSHRFFVSFEYSAAGKLRKSPQMSEVVAALNREAMTLAASMESCGNVLISSDDRDWICEALFMCMCKQSSQEWSYAEVKEALLNKYERTAGHPVADNQISVNDIIVPEEIDDRLSPNFVVIDGKFTTYAYVPSTGYPNNVQGGWLQIFFADFEDVDVDFWIKKEDPASIAKKLPIAIRLARVRNSDKDDTSSDKEELEGTINSAYYLKQRLADGDDFCYISTVLTIYGNTFDEMSNRYDMVRDWLIRHDFSLRTLVFQQCDAFQACVPLGYYDERIFRKSRRNIMSSMLGSCYPFTAYDLNDEGGIFMGVNARYGSPVFFNGWNTNLYSSNNGLILGMTGSGKSFTASLLSLRLRERGYPVYIIAPLKGYEFYRMCTAINGEIIKISPGSAQNINVMEIRKADQADMALLDGEIVTSGSILTDKIMDLGRFFSIMIPDLTIMEKQTLNDALMRTYGKFGITMDNKSLFDPSGNGEYRKMPVLGDLRSELNPEKEIRDDDGTIRKVGEDGKRLYQVLGTYVSGPAKCFNQQTNVNLNNKFVVLDVSDLTPEMLPLGMFICLSYVMAEIKMDRKKRSMILIDECWKLMKASQMSAESVLECFKVARGYATSVWACTQDISDIISSEHGRAIINNAKMKILLPMEYTMAQEISKYIDMTSGEIQALNNTGLKPGSKGRRTPLFIAGNNHLLINVESSKTEFDLITTNASDLERQIEEKKKERSGMV